MSDGRPLRWADPEPLPLDRGGALPGLELQYRQWGAPTPARDNAVVVCHALTGSSDVAAWWGPVLGPGRALDPGRDWVIAVDAPGSCHGSTGPTTLRGDGRRWGAAFPALTVRDLVRAQQRLLDELGVSRIACVVGGSLGGMQALEFGLMDRRVAAVAAIACPLRHEAWALAWSEAQRRALAADPRHLGGAYSAEAPPVAGLAAARAVAMVSYRSPAGLGRRFGRTAGRSHPHAVQDWLHHHGESLVARFDANAYTTLLAAMDAHDVGADRGGAARALATLQVPVLVVSLSSDHLYPPGEQEALAALLPRATLVRLETVHGHDGFLIEADRVGELLARFRAGRTAATAPVERGAA
jgi:homoserine O-acetyltransferase